MSIESYDQKALRVSCAVERPQQLENTRQV